MQVFSVDCISGGLRNDCGSQFSLRKNGFGQATTLRVELFPLTELHQRGGSQQEVPLSCNQTLVVTFVHRTPFGSKPRLAAVSRSW